MYEKRKDFTSIAELRQIKVLLDTLEARIRNFRHLLPKPDNRRGLMDIGGTALKILLGVTTAADILHLHQTIEKLHTMDADNSLARKSDDFYKESRLVLPPRNPDDSKFIHGS